MHDQINFLKPWLSTAPPPTFPTFLWQLYKKSKFENSLKLFTHLLCVTTSEKTQLTTKNNFSSNINFEIFELQIGTFLLPGTGSIGFLLCPQYDLFLDNELSFLERDLNHVLYVPFASFYAKFTLELNK